MLAKKLLLAATAITCAVLPALAPGQERAFLLAEGDAAPALILDDLRDPSGGLPDAALVQFIDCASERCADSLRQIEQFVWQEVQASAAEDDRTVAVAAYAVGSTAEQVAAFAQDLGLTFTVFPDPDGARFDLIARDGVPRTVILDGAGTVRHLHAGWRFGREAAWRAALLDGGGSLAPQAAPEAPRYARDIVGQKAPDVPIEEWINEPHGTADGKYVLVDFWATWCGPCIMALDLAEPLHTQFKDRVFAYAISDEPAGRVRPTVERQGWKQPIAIDTQARAKNELEIRAIPHAFLANPQGKVIWQGHPAELWSNDAAKLRALLAGEDAE